MKTKTDGRPVMISADSVSAAWAKAISELAAPGVTRLSPLTLNIRGFAEDGAVAELDDVRTAVDAFLVAQEKRDVENVAWTIFPKAWWELAGGDLDTFFDLCIDGFQRVQNYAAGHNSRGSYFQRLMDYQGGGQGPNQLKWMIHQYREHPRSRRASKFQATTFDPVRDHRSDGQLEFPCLQQISCVVRDGTMTLNAFYATQQLARKGYGNYLGLARLGAFMAAQMGVRFEQLSVFVGKASMDAKKREPDVVELLAALKPALGRAVATYPGVPGGS